MQSAEVHVLAASSASGAIRTCLRKLNIFHLEKTASSASYSLNWLDGQFVFHLWWWWWWWVSVRVALVQPAAIPFSNNNFLLIRIYSHAISFLLIQLFYFRPEENKQNVISGRVLLFSSSPLKEKTVASRVSHQNMSKRDFRNFYDCLGCISSLASYLCIAPKRMLIIITSKDLPTTTHSSWPTVWCNQWTQRAPREHGDLNGSEGKVQ